jgi:hypothetical protein
MAAGTAINLVIGVGGPADQLGSWGNCSAINTISGSSTLPITSTPTFFYIGFTGGTLADINHMVLYATER